ncbi:hypothetical protein D3C83_100320 [compost metagenome]
MNSVRLTSELPAAQRPRFAYRGTDNPRFAALIALRENPPAMVTSGGVDVCDMPPVTMRVRSAP